MTVQDFPRLGNYLIKRELRKDGFGILYEALSQDDQPILLRALAPDIVNSENFVIRLELLKPLLPRLLHPNLLPILEIGEDSNILYLAKPLVASVSEEGRLSLLEDYDYRQSPHRQRVLESLFEGIAQGLAALERFREGYFQGGIHHDALSPAHIHLAWEPELDGEGLRPIPKVDAFVESFLFHGDQPQAALHHRLTAPLYQHRQHPEQEVDLYPHEGFFTSASRRGQSPTSSHTLFSFGALLYHTLTGQFPKGIFPLPTEFDSSLDPHWDELVNLCLTHPLSGSAPSIDQVLEKLKLIRNHHSQLTPQQQRLRELTPPKGMTLVILPEKVMLGASEGPEEELPAFLARVHPFFMDVTPVTCAEFARFLPSYQPSTYSREPDAPATQVTWHMAKAYCQWRSEKEGLAPHTYRLPTEYEWEAAARGLHGHFYPWGMEPDPKRLLCGVHKQHGACPVKKYPPGRFGIYSLLGNTWEWTESSWGPHPVAKEWSHPHDPTHKVLKGGCWYTPLDRCRATLRSSLAPNQRRGDVGFRCVRLVDPL